MGKAELEQLWHEQTLGTNARFDPIRHVARLRGKRRSVMVLTAVAGVISLAALGLRAAKLLADPGFTLATGTAELLLAALPLLCVLGTAVHLRRQHAELDALRLDTRQCIEFAYRTVRREIRDIRRAGPPILAGFVGLFAVSKWQSIAAGREVLTHEAFSIFLVAGVAVIAVAVLQHRLTAFLQPRLAHLENLRQQLD
ncbi:MAG: hypothetical protein AAGE01_02895 [Pseudomonadota bacterium]